MSDEDQGGMKRRTFLTRIGLGGVAATAFAGVGSTARYLFPTVLYEPSQKVKIGRPTEFAEGTVTFVEEAKVYLHREAGAIHAVSATCTHLGCVVALEERGFSCPCHGSVFDADGNPMRGPAPRPLPWLEVTLSPDGQIVVDRARSVDPGTKLAV